MFLTKEVNKILKYSVDNLESVDEKYRELYEEGDDGRYTLGVDGVVGSQVVSEYKEMVAKLERLNLDALSKLDEYGKTQSSKDDKSKLDTVQQQDSGIPNELREIKERYARREKELNDKNAELAKEVDKLNSSMNSLIVDTQIKEIGESLGIAPTASADLLARGRGIFKLKNNSVVATRDDGTLIYSDKQVDQPLSIKEWVASLKKDAPHLFVPDKGVEVRSGDTRQLGEISLDDLSSGNFSPEKLASGELFVNSN